MQIRFIQDILSSQEPGSYETQQMTINISKKELLELINKTDDKEGFAIKKQTIYTDRKLNNPRQFMETDNDEM